MDEFILYQGLEKNILFYKLSDKNMTQIVDTINLPKGFDRRVKLTDSERKEIRSLHKEGNTIRSIARLFEKKCSRRLIQYILYPERLEEIYKRQKENKNWLKYYDKDKRREYMRGHREYKALVLGIKRKTI